MDSESSQTSEVEVKQTMYDCCICGQTTETSHENPIGLVTYLTPTSGRFIIAQILYSFLINIT